MKNNRKIVRSETLETVRERERERELYSNEIGFINYAKNTIKVNNTKIRQINQNKGRIVCQNRHIVCPFCVQKIYSFRH